MQLTYQKLKPFALSYLTAPLAVFFAGYLRAPFAVAGLAVLAFAWWYAVCKTPQVKQVGQEEQGITLSVPKLVLLFALMLLWGYLGGQTGFFYQNSDWGYRNAIYRDLITNSWPVYYPQKDTALVYYIGHWLVPAALTKPVYALFGLDAAWMFARMALWGWTALGTYLAALNLLVYLRADTGKKQGIGLLFLIFFSGMDILGALYSSRLPDLLAYDAMHLEWWTNDFQFSSLTTCLFWVFNQTVGAWLATVCFLQEKDCRNYLLLGTACLMCGPFPFVGLVIFMVVRGIVLLAQRQKGVLQSAFSPANVLVLVVVLSITASYFLANNAFGYSVLGETVAGNQAAQQTFGQNVLTSLQKGMLVFYLLDAGIYLLLLWRQNRRSWLFYTCAVSLFIIPFFKVGQGCDFCMWVSIPAIFILMTLCARYFIALVGTKWRDGTLAQHAVTILLAATLLIGACTPAMEIYRGICHIAKEGTFCLENEEPYTLADRPVSLNFETQNCENKLFFTYFAK